jgi:hypothetical protein
MRYERDGNQNAPQSVRQARLQLVCQAQTPLFSGMARKWRGHPPFLCAAHRNGEAYQSVLEYALKKQKPAKRAEADFGRSEMRSYVLYTG